MMGWPKGKPRKAVVHEDEPMEPLDAPWSDAEILEAVIGILPLPAIATCDVCRFWHPTGEVNHGQCRRFPAHPRNNSPYAHWPVMTATDWCGEFKAKD